MSAIVRDYRGIEIVILHTLYLHVRERHRDLLRKLNIQSIDQFINIIRRVLINPSEVYIDDKGSIYYLLRINDLYLNVVVAENVVRTAYLLGMDSYYRMRYRRWRIKIY